MFPCEQKKNRYAMTATRATTSFFTFAQTGTYGLSYKILDGNEYVNLCPLERGCGIVSEARQATLDSWKLLFKAVTFMEANWP